MKGIGTLVTVLFVALPVVASEIVENLIAEAVGMQGSKLTLDGEYDSAYSNRPCRLYVHRYDQDDRFYASLFMHGSPGRADEVAQYQHGFDSVYNFETPRVLENTLGKLKIETKFTINTNGIQGTQVLFIRQLSSSRINVQMGTSNTAGVDHNLSCVFERGL